MKKRIEGMEVEEREVRGGKWRKGVGRRREVEERSGKGREVEERSGNGREVEERSGKEKGRIPGKVEKKKMLHLLKEPPRKRS